MRFDVIGPLALALVLVLSSCTCSDDDTSPGHDATITDVAGDHDGSHEVTGETTEEVAGGSEVVQEVVTLEVVDEVIDSPMIALPEEPVEATIVTDALPSPSEGLVFGGDGTLYLSSAEGQILAMAPDGSTEPLVDLLPLDDGLPKGCAGLAIGPDGALYACRYEVGRIERVDLAGDLTVMVFLEVPTPNTVTFDAGGTLWLTSSDGDDGLGFVARMGLEDTTYEKVAEGVAHANGIAFAPDSGTVYFSSSSPGSIHSAPIAADGTVGEASLVTDDPLVSVADGLLMAPDGTLFIAGFGTGSLVAWTGEALVAVAEGQYGMASIAWGAGEGFSPTAIYATNLIFPKIVSVELSAAP